MIGEGNYIKPAIEKINREDISKEPLGSGETEIIMQRHEKYIRNFDHERAGSLEPEEAKKSYEQAVEILESKFAGLTGEERGSVDVLVIASNTEYGNAKGMRSFETANEVVKGILNVLEKHGLNRNQLLNTRSNVNAGREEVVASKVKTIQEPRMFIDSPDFVRYLEDKYGKGTQDFWIAFEEDREKEIRENMGAEGVDGILKRYSKFIDILRNFSKHYHAKHPGKRLIIWPVSHYDTISPYAKNKVTKTDPNEFLGVEYGAGISLRIDQEGKVTSKFQGQEFSVD